MEKTRKMYSNTKVEVDGKLVSRYSIEETVFEHGEYLPSLTSNKRIDYEEYVLDNEDYRRKAKAKWEKDEPNYEYEPEEWRWDFCAHDDALYISYLWDYHTEQLQQWLDEGILWEKVQSDIRSANIDVDHQVEKWAASDKEIQTLRRTGDNDKADKLTNMLRVQAKDMIYRERIYR